jgi:NTE family protein
MQRSVDFLLIGGGLASATAAKTLRAEGKDESILLLSAESTVPYHRPPLSKHFLAGSQGVDRILIERETFYRQHSIELALGTRAIGVAPGDHLVRTDAGDEIQYRKLLIATGGSARRLDVPGASLPGVFLLHTVEDAEAIRAAAAAGKRAAIVGGSFLGLELAGTLTAMGVETVLIELGATLVARLYAPEVSDFLLRYGSGRGVKFALGARATAIEGEGRAQAVVAQTGERFPCDFVVLCVGIAPEVGFLEGSGIALDDGILVDERLRTSAPDVFAAGDVANFVDPVSGLSRRVEHWDNAVKQGRLAARNMLGRNLPYEELSYFYAELFDLYFDVLGAVEEGEERIERGTLERRSYALFHLKNDVARALFSIGRPADEVRSAGELIRHRTNLAAVKPRLSDESFSLQDIPAQTVLILQGGGALGAFECGVVRALEENAIYPDIVAGVSIGAFNGAIVASHPRQATAALQSFWSDLAVNAPDLFDPDLTRTATALQILTFGVPRFFRPRWLLGFDWMNPTAKGLISLYDTTPVRELIGKYVDFPRLKSSPVRLLISAVDVSTAELVTFDSYTDDLTPDHILASGSLPPGFPWTTIAGRHYWDGGIISNSPLDLVIDRCGPSGKRVFVVDLFAGQKPLPTNLVEVLARRDEILYAERVRNDVGTQELVSDFRALVHEILAEISTDVASRLRSHPRYIELMGTTAPTTITRITREGMVGEPSSRDYDFSRAAVSANREQGYRRTLAALQRGPMMRS